MSHRMFGILVALGGVVLAGCSTAGAGLDEIEADARTAVPDTWTTDVVADDRVGAFVVSAPPDATRWTPGDDLEELSETTSGTAWEAFWSPQLESAGLQSNIRAVIADAATIDDAVLSWQVNVTPRRDGGSFDDPETMARDLADGLAGQGLEIVEAGTTAWAGQSISTVSFRVPDDVFGGEVRYVRQWFVPRNEPAALWSLSCDGPDDPDAVDTQCETVLNGFRPAPEDR
jgi:hypothetical protein